MVPPLQHWQHCTGTLLFFMDGARSTEHSTEYLIFFLRGPIPAEGRSARPE